MRNFRVPPAMPPRKLGDDEVTTALVRAGRGLRVKTGHSHTLSTVSRRRSITSNIKVKDTCKMIMHERGSLWDWKLRMRKNEALLIYEWILWFLVYLEANWPLCWRLTFHFRGQIFQKYGAPFEFERHIHEFSTPLALGLLKLHT